MTQKWVVRYAPTMDVSVTVEAADEDEAVEKAGASFKEYAGFYRDSPSLGIVAVVETDGVGYYELDVEDKP